MHILREALQATACCYFAVMLVNTAFASPAETNDKNRFPNNIVGAGSRFIPDAINTSTESNQENATPPIKEEKNENETKEVMKSPRMQTGLVDNQAPSDAVERK